MCISMVPSVIDPVQCLFYSIHNNSDGVTLHQKKMMQEVNQGKRPGHMLSSITVPPYTEGRRPFRPILIPAADRDQQPEPMLTKQRQSK